MKNLHLYTIPIAYMLLYVLAILLSGVWLFLLSQGVNHTEVITAFEKILSDPVEKSVHGLVEVVTPHLFSMTALIFVVAHFLLFSTKIPKRFSLVVTAVLFVTALINIFSYFLISVGVVMSGWIKLISLVLFLLVFFVLLLMVAFSL
jgi:hypothetical protein